MDKKRDRRAIQRLMQNKEWEVFESFFNNFMKEKFLQNSVKKSSEFDTIWFLAFDEGGKFYLNEFINSLENEARKANEVDDIM
jgi:hypothetical protein